MTGLTALSLCRQVRDLQLRMYALMGVALLLATSVLLSRDSILVKVLMLVLTSGCAWALWTFARKTRALRAALGLASWTLRLYLVSAVFLGVASALIVEALLLAPTVVRGTSMAPGLRHRDVAVVWRGAYGVPAPFSAGYWIPRSQPQRGDTVVFTYSGLSPMLKRIIGLPGDVVEIKPGEVKVNGTRLQAGEAFGIELAQLPGEPDLEVDDHTRAVPEQIDATRYITLAKPGHDVARAPSTHVRKLPARFPCEWREPMLRCKVPQGSFFVLGDNRPTSLDSRYFGTIKPNELLGRVVLRAHWQDSSSAWLAAP